jgi:chemosensory pili system protein ChpA (sensor histidine kinase/response regulator)
VTELAGRGVGMDVVRAEVNAMGGRIETASTPGQGTQLPLVLPLTTAVTQVVMLRCGELQVAVPSTLVEVVRRVPHPRSSGLCQRRLRDGRPGAALLLAGRAAAGGAARAGGRRTQPVVVVRSAAQRVALHVDEVVGNQEVVVKNLGPQLARLPGLAGMTLLPSGAVALIYNPVALAALYGEAARAACMAHAGGGRPVVAAPPPAGARQAPLVLVVDDSLTVRRVTQRLLSARATAWRWPRTAWTRWRSWPSRAPAVLLSDIEMPRMDGFDLVRNVRADAALAGCR